MLGVVILLSVPLWHGGHAGPFGGARFDIAEDGPGSGFGLCWTCIVATAIAGILIASLPVFGSGVVFATRRAKARHDRSRCWRQPAPRGPPAW